MPRKILLFFLLFSLSALSSAAVLSETVGRVGGDVFTSRQAQLSGLMERLLSGGKDSGPSPVDPPSEAFRKERSALLLEVAVSKEAEVFGLTNGDSEEVASLIEKTQKHLQSRSEWRKLQYTPEEISQLARYKLASRALVKLKSESMKSPVSDIEAQKYFEENRRKFGNLPIDSFREQIKNVLEREQLDERLRSWFEIIRRKYQVRESLTGSASGGT